MEFTIIEVKRTGLQSAVSVRLLNRTGSKKVHGFVATLKDNFGFIETANHDQEIFFHYRSGVLSCLSVILVKAFFKILIGSVESDLSSVRCVEIWTVWNWETLWNTCPLRGKEIKSVLRRLTK